MSLRFSQLQNIAGGDIFFNISKHFRPVVGGGNAIVGFGVASGLVGGGLSTLVLRLGQCWNELGQLREQSEVSDKLQTLFPK